MADERLLVQQSVDEAAQVAVTPNAVIASSLPVSTEPLVRSAKRSGYVYTVVRRYSSASGRAPRQVEGPVLLTPAEATWKKQALARVQAPTQSAPVLLPSKKEPRTGSV